MSQPITKELFRNWEKLCNEAGGLEDQITDRITEVLKIWFAAFGGKLTNWYFDGAGEGFTGNLGDSMDRETIYSIIVECNPDPVSNDRYDMVILDKDGDEWGWNNSIPIRWLFEDCEKEIVNGKALFEKAKADKAAATAAKKAAKKLSNAELVAQAKAKLTAEELAAIKKSR